MLKKNPILGRQLCDDLVVQFYPELKLVYPELSRESFRNFVSSSYMCQMFQDKSMSIVGHTQAPFFDDALFVNFARQLVANVFDEPTSMDGGRDDASFSVAALWSEDSLCLAGRLRDDVRTAKDKLTLVIRKERRDVPLLNPPDNAVLAHEDFGWHYEVCWPRPWFATAGASVPIAVQLHDEDGTGDVDVLATAPIFGTIPVGALDLLSE